MRIFLDTNVLVSACTARGICADLVRHILAEHELVTGAVNSVELRCVLTERFQVSPARLSNIEAALRDETTIPMPGAPSSLPVRDPDDR